MDVMNANPRIPAAARDLRLDHLAEIAVRVGLGGLQPGQELLMTAPLEALPLARRIPRTPIAPERRWSPPCSVTTRPR